MSRRVIPKGLIANQARGNKQFNFPLSSIGARGIGLRNAIINRSTNCCPRSDDGNGGGGNGSGGNGGGANENFITLEQALDQGEVDSGQILFLDSNQGLVLENDFTVKNGGFIILADIENPQENLSTGGFAGIFVPQGKKLTVLGEIVLGIISSDAVNNKDVYGVYNKGTIEISRTGSITMGDIRSVNQNAHGIFQESTIQKHTDNTAGAIQMGNITSNSANAFGVKNGQLNDVRVQIGNVSGGNEAAAVNLFDGNTTGNMSAHVIAGDVMNSGNSSTFGVNVNELSGSFSCGNVDGGGDVLGIRVFGRLSGSATCGNVEGDGVNGIFVFGTLIGSATCGNVKGTGSDIVNGINVLNNLTGSATCGNVEGTGNATGIFVENTLSGSATCGNIEGTGNATGINVENTLSGSATCGNVEGTGTTYGIAVVTLSGSATCGDVSSTGQSTTDVITVSGLLFITVYPEAQVNIGNISAANGICRGAFSNSETAILAGTTNIGSVSSNVNFDYNDSDVLRSGGIVINSNTQNLSDSFVTYNGIGKGLKFEVSIDNDQYVVTNTDLDNATDYVNGQTITINGAYFGGDDVTLTIIFDTNGAITNLSITGSPPTDPRVTTTGLITTNGLSGNFTVKDCSLTKAPNVNANRFFNTGIIVANLSGSATCGNVEGGGTTYGIGVFGTLSGSATCGNVEGVGFVNGINVPNNNLTGSATCGNVEGNAIVTGINVFNISGSATCGNVEGTGNDPVYGIDVDNTLSGSATCGNVEGTGTGNVSGIAVSTLSGSATCGNVEGNAIVTGIGGNTLSGSATCGNVEGTGTVIGIGFFGTLSGSATCGTVEGTGINGGTINGNVIIKSASTGVESLVGTAGNPGTGKVIIGAPQNGWFSAGTFDTNKLSAYIYDGSVKISSKN